MRTPILLPLVVSILLLLTPCRADARQELEAARTEYVAALRDKLSAETLDGLELAPAKAAIDKLAAIADPQVLDILMLDAQKIAQRLGEYGVKLEKGKMVVEQQTKALKDAAPDARAGIEQKVKDAEKELATAKSLFPLLRELNTAMTEGLLASIDHVATAKPDQVWDGLVTGLRADMTQLVTLDESVRTQNAELKTVREKLSGAKEKDRAEMEKRGAELAGKVAAGGEQLIQLEKLRTRRIETLARIWPSLDKGRQTKELATLKDNLKDDAPGELRAFSVEFYGALPLPDAYTTPLAVMKKASNERDKIEKELDPLREQYQRAAKALQTAIAGAIGSKKPTGPVSVPATVKAAEENAHRALVTASAQSEEAVRLVAAAARGIGRALAAMEAETRQKTAIELTKLAKSYSDKIVRCAVLSAFGLVKDEKVAAGLRLLAEKDPELNTRLASLETLAAMGDEATVDLCCDKLLKDAEWRVRAAAMRVLVAIPHKKGVATLIQSVANEVGRLIEDAEQALAELTGQHFNGDANLWKDWWSKNEASFEPKKGGAKAGLALGDELTGPVVVEQDWRKKGGHVSFYGITTRSNRILFVLDRSGSMMDPATDSMTGKASASAKWDVAKNQLTSAISGLKDGDMFNIVHFSSDVDRWQKTMQKASAETRKRASTFVEKELEAVGGTNIYDSLREAFRLAGIGAIDKAYQSNVDTIFFLTDGEPTQGEVTDANEILRRVKEWNQLSRIVVHTVGVGKDHNTAFLRRLAEENGGMYVSQ